jgi:tyrosine-protein phosphatase YwqE
VSFWNRLTGRSRAPEFPEVQDFAAIGTDIHSHLIPGIDDGVQNLEESVTMIRQLRELGFRKLVTTPHIMSDYYRNTPETILGGLETVRAAVAAEGIDVTVDAAAEYYLDEVFVQRIESNEPLLTFAGNYVLFEVSYVNPPDNVHRVAFELKVRGYTPILAHPERYPYWYNRLTEFEKLKEAGLLFQINVNSLCGYYGPGAKKIGEWMVDQSMIDLIGTDLHGDRHLEALRRVVREKYFWKLAANGVRNSLL